MFNSRRLKAPLYGIELPCYGSWTVKISISPYNCSDEEQKRNIITSALSTVYLLRLLFTFRHRLALSIEKNRTRFNNVRKLKAHPTKFLSQQDDNDDDDDDDDSGGGGN